MANQFGSFAGSFANTFVQMMQADQENKRRNALAKQQARLFELQVAGAEKQISAQDTLGDILTGNFVGEAETVGELVPAQDGRSAVPDINVGGQEVGLLDLLTGNNELPPGTVAEGQRAAIDSGQLSLKDLFGGGSSPTSFSKDAIAAGILPGTPEFRDAFLAKNKADETSTVLAELLLDQKQEDFEQSSAERKAANEEKRQGKARTRIAVRNHFTLVNEAVEIMRDLKSTVLRSGIPGGDELRTVTAIWGATQEFFGKDSPQATIIAGKRDRLKKLLSETLVDSIKSMKGVVSVARQEALLNSLPTLENMSVANAQLFGDQMRDLLDEAEIQGIEVGGRELIEQFIANPLAGLEEDFNPKSAFDSVRESAGQGIDAATAFAKEKAQPVLSAAAEKARDGLASAKEIAKLTVEDLKQIDKQTIETWTEEQKVALDKRLKELGF